MRERSAVVPLLLLLMLLLTLFYPALFLGDVVAPEAGMRDVPPWRGAWGPYPRPSAPAVQAATHLGPRLAVMSRDGAAAAVWNPWIGGGRAGWLGSAGEGGAPLPLVAAFTARAPYTWTALVALQAGLGLLLCWWALRRLGRSPWAAGAGALAYALSGAVTGHWLDWQGSAFALGPAALALAMSPRTGSRRWLGAGGITVALLLLAGLPALQFLLVAAAAAVVLQSPGAPLRRAAAATAAAVLGLAVILPRLWLFLAAAEPGAGPGLPRPAPGLPGIGALLVPSPTAGAAGAATAGHALGGLAGATTPDGYLGAVVLVLAGLGLVGEKLRSRLLWGGILAAATVLSVAPLPDVPPLPVRPLGAMALAAAVLAAAGVDLLGRRAGHRAAVGAVAALLLFFDLFPAAAQRLPYAAPRQEKLPRPFTAEILARGARIAALGATLPPDLGATLALADVRAASLEREPRYAAALALSDQGTITFARVLDPVLPRLGTRFFLEPLPLRVVSGTLFSSATFATALPAPAHGRWALALDVPPGPTRIALPTGESRPGPVTLRLPGTRVHPLEPDPALASESDDWTWYAVPADWPAGAAILDVPRAQRPDRPLAILWDTSGLRLHAEIQGARIWRSDRARPAAFLARAVASGDAGGIESREPDTVAVADRSVSAGVLERRPGDRLRALALYADRLELEVEAGGPRLAVAQVKYRPALWRATVDGTPVRTVAVDGLWTGIPVPGGPVHVTLAAVVPAWTWGIGLTALLALVTLAVMGERR